MSLDFGDRVFEVRGTFEIVDPPRRLRYRWSENEFVDVRIERRDSGSLLKLKHTWPATDEDRFMISAGWSNALELLSSAVPAAGSPA